MKILTIITVLTLIIASIGIVAMPNNDNNNENIKIIQKIIDDISNKPNTQIIYKDIIGDRFVHYWQHIRNDIEIKNDYILIHQDITNNNIITYEKQWREIPKNIGSLNNNLETIEKPISWKKKVLFLEKEDCKDFYTFYNNENFPILCWEVRHKDGTTSLYDNTGEKIGYGIPSPYNGFSLSGYHEPDLPDPWLQWRLNADSYFTLWSNSTISISFPTPDYISSHISDPEYEVFFEIAHGGYYYFVATSTEWYYASDVTNAIIERDPMRFAFIGSCGGMDQTGPGSWSHAFRKGQIIDTVTVGYTGMGDCPGWSVSLPWQDMMFSYMDEDYTIKESFDIASAYYPTIAPCVVFVGDPTLKIKEGSNGGDDDDDDDDSDGPIPKVDIYQPNIGSTLKGTVTINGTATNPDGPSIKWVFISIDSGEWIEAEGTTEWRYTWDTTTVEDGEHTISAIASDGAKESGAKTITVTVQNNEPDDEDPIPTLTCEGSLNWGRIKAGQTVQDEFTIKNTGEPLSNLSWTITETPTWGTWTFSQTSGNNLQPEDEPKTITVTITTPTEEKTYQGDITIINTENPEQNCKIPVTLTTPKTHPLIKLINQLINQNLILQILKIILKI